MRISIITFHDTFNFGATLQCAALSKTLSSMGNDVTVLNYIPKYIKLKKSWLKEFHNINRNGSFTKRAKAVLRAFYYAADFFVIKERNEKYESFMEKNIRRTEVIENYDELQNYNDADLYICGSDQIWNPYLTGGQFDKAYFLDYISKNKVAYGVSTGELDLFSNKKELVNLTSGFDFISVREKKTAEDLSMILNRDIKVVLDCTLLLDDADYKEMEEKVPNERPYLLFYNVSVSSLANRTAIRIARDRRIQIIDVSPSPFVKVPGSKKINNIGPGEFLSYVRNAECIVTNSFHGTVFSIIYKKEFYTIPHKTRSDRVAGLLSLLGLSGRLVTNEESFVSETIDYKPVIKALASSRADSINFLNSVGR